MLFLIRNAEDNFLHQTTTFPKVPPIQIFVHRPFSVQMSIPIPEETVFKTLRSSKLLLEAFLTI